MMGENEKAPQIRVQLCPSPCHIISIHQEHDHITILKMLTDQVSNILCQNKAPTTMAVTLDQNPRLGVD